MAWIKRLGAVRPSGHAGLILLTCFAVFFGLASVMLPGWFIFSVLLVPTVAALVLARPEYGLTAFIALVSGLLHPALIPRVPVLGGAVAATDVTLAMLAVYAFWTVVAQTERAKSVPVAGARWLAVSLGLYGVCFVIAVVTSLWVRDLIPTAVLGEARRLVYLVTLPIAVVILRQPERQERFVFSIVVLGCLLSMGQILQGVFNLPVFGDQQMSSLGLQGQLGDATTRAITLGINLIIYSLLLTVGAYLLGVTSNWRFFAVSGLLLMGIFLTYGRTIFVSVIISLLIVVSWLNLRKLPRLVGSLVILIALGSAFGMFWKPDSLSAVYHRMTTIDEAIEHGTSAQWRFWEAEAMLPHIQKNPLTGIGLGADYWTRGTTKSPELNRYIHNGYLYMAGKMGLPALAFFLSSMVAILVMGRRLAKSNALSWARVVGAAGAALMVHFAFSSITEPHLMSDRSIVVIAIAGALVYLAARRTTCAGGATVTGVPSRRRIA